MSDNLDTLRKTAEAATPGPWDLYSTQDYEVFCATNFTDSNYDPPAVTYGSDRSEDAEFIATFNPETVLALLSRLEQAEQQRDSSREACKTLAEVLSNHSEWIVEATDSQDLIGEDGDGDWDVVWDRVMELGEAKRKAEQAVARVREFSDQMLKPHGQNVVVAARVRERLAEILDGDGRG